MLYKISIIFVLLVYPLNFLVSQESQEVKFSRGSALYEAGKYQEALNEWLAVYNTGNHSANLDYNIGNAYFKLNNIPGAILFYERARLLKPGNEDISYNLQIARTLVIDKFVEIPEIFFVSWYNFISLSLSTNLWAWISLVTFILLLLSLSVYIYTARYRHKVIGFWIALLMAIISILSISFSLRNRSLVYNSHKAIVFSPQVNGKSAPDKSGTDLFILHEGTRVTIVDGTGDWYEIRLSDGNKGWVPSNSLNKI